MLLYAFLLFYDTTAAETFLDNAEYMAGCKFLEQLGLLS